jgi:hypothetical protein
MKAWLIPISLGLCAGTARADQCAWIDADVAAKARTIVERAPKVIDFCEPCGDQAPGEPHAVHSADVTAADGDFKELRVNGTAVDLAYVFVQTDATHYRNLAALAGCPATGVSPSLEVAAETKHGVLITADDDAVPSPITLPAIAAPPPPPPAPAVAPPAPPAVYVYATTTHEIAWSVLALAAAGGLVTGSALTLLLVASRRRRTMRPRAAELRSQAAAPRT